MMNFFMKGIQPVMVLALASIIRSSNQVDGLDASAGYLIFAGGLFENGSYTSEVYAYDMTNNITTKLPNLVPSNHTIFLVEHEGRLIAVSGSPSTSQILVNSSRTWALIANPPALGDGATAVHDGNVIRTFGGAGSPKAFVVYEACDGIWTTAATTSLYPHAYNRPGIWDKSYYFCGGPSNVSASADCEYYTLKFNQWFDLKINMTHKRYHSASIGLHGKILVFGGGTNTSEQFDLWRLSWSRIADLPTKNNEYPTITSDGVFVYLAGQDGLYKYDPSKDVWGKLASLPPSMQGILAPGFIHVGDLPHYECWVY